MEKRFYDYADLIISKYEGGYYHPNMKASLKNGSAMGDSGETMFGMDRKAGAGLFTKGKGKQFWDIIDGQNASIKWSWNYKPGGILGIRLRNLAAEIMYENIYASSTYNKLTDKAKKLVKKSPKLEVHLFYGCWNGVGYFQGFCDVINKAVEAGTTNIKKLEEIALNSRKNHAKQFMRDRAKNMEAIWAELPRMSAKRIAKTSLLILASLGVLVGGGILIWRKVK